MMSGIKKPTFWYASLERLSITPPIWAASTMTENNLGSDSLLLLSEPWK